MSILPQKKKKKKKFCQLWVHSELLFLNFVPSRLFTLNQYVAIYAQFLGSVVLISGK